MAGRDILGIAQTGTGKTAAFALPILHQLLALQGRPAPKTCRALVLAPTRELAVQIEAAFRTFAGGARLTTLLVLGGMSRSAQVRAMARGVDVVVATPGRLTDLMADRSILLDQTRWVVLDEADRMLDMGFIQPVRKIVAALHPRRQSALFSATMPAEVGEPRPGLPQGPGPRRGRPPGHHRRAHRAARRAHRDRRKARPPRRASHRPRRRPHHRLRPHQARRRPRGAEPRQGRRRRRGDPRQQGAERPPARAERLPQRPGARPRRHRHRRPRHRRARRHPHHQLRPARRARGLRPPHRPHRRATAPTASPSPSAPPTR